MKSSGEADKIVFQSMRNQLSCITGRICNLDITKGQNASCFMENREFPYPEKGLAPTKLVP